MAAKAVVAKPEVFDAELTEVETTLKRLARGIPKAKANERKFFMKAQMPMLGLTVPQQRAAIKKGYGFSALPAGEQLPIWSHIWFAARTHEAKMQGGFFVYRLEDVAPETLWETVAPWAGAINCWDQSDTLSGVYARLLEAKPKLVLPTLKAWNQDANPWKRRQSLVSLFYYAQLRTKVRPVREVLRLVTPLLEDPDYYVQKGVGWTLRETFNAYPVEALAYLEKHARDIHPDAFSAAIEKLDAGQKARVKELRKGRARSAKAKTV